MLKLALADWNKLFHPWFHSPLAHSSTSDWRLTSHVQSYLYTILIPHFWNTHLYELVTNCCFHKRQNLYCQIQPQKNVCLKRSLPSRTVSMTELLLLCQDEFQTSVLRQNNIHVHAAYIHLSTMRGPNLHFHGQWHRTNGSHCNNI